MFSFFFHFSFTAYFVALSTEKNYKWYIKPVAVKTLGIHLMVSKYNFLI